MSQTNGTPTPPEPCWGGSLRPDWYNDGNARELADLLAGPIQCPGCGTTKPLREYDLLHMPDGRIACDCGHVLTIDPYEADDASQP